MLRHHAAVFCDPDTSPRLHDRARRDHVHRSHPFSARASRRLADGYWSEISPNASNAGSPTVTCPPAPTRAAIAAFYNTVNHGMAIQARDGADRTKLSAHSRSRDRGVGWPHPGPAPSVAQACSQQPLADLGRGDGPFLGGRTRGQMRGENLGRLGSDAARHRNHRPKVARRQRLNPCPCDRCHRGVHRSRLVEVAHVPHPLRQCGDGGRRQESAARPQPHAAIAGCVEQVMHCAVGMFGCAQLDRGRRRNTAAPRHATPGRRRACRFAARRRCATQPRTATPRPATTGRARTAHST